MTISLVKVCFNTVNGKYCCNAKATDVRSFYQLSFNTVNGKYCCNYKMAGKYRKLARFRFNTVNGKYCCNAETNVRRGDGPIQFQYRKR